jgi:hypothetical protein
MTLEDSLALGVALEAFGLLVLVPLVFWLVGRVDSL